MGSDNVVNALHVRSQFGRLLDRVENEGKPLVIRKRGRPRAVLMILRDYVRLAVPEPEVLRVIGESRRKGIANLNARQINQVIKSARPLERSMISLRLVLDTNIVVSAAIKPQGLQRTCSPPGTDQTHSMVCVGPNSG